MLAIEVVSMIVINHLLTVCICSSAVLALAPSPSSTTTNNRRWLSKGMNPVLSQHSLRSGSIPPSLFDNISGQRTNVGPLHASPSAEEKTKDKTNEQQNHQRFHEPVHVVSSSEQEQEMESWESDSKTVELLLLTGWAAGISAFILMNNFVGPWPEGMKVVPERIYFVFHMLGGMLFGGGIILTTCIEWLVAQNKNSPVLQFWFDKVPLLDAVIVLPALSVSMISGTGLSIKHYGGLGSAPTHISIVFYTLVLFAAWWALTDLTTQGKALAAVNEWAVAAASPDKTKHQEIPDIVHRRIVSNVVSCMFVFALYGIMVMKPGTLHSLY